MESSMFKGYGCLLVIALLVIGILIGVMTAKIL